MALQPQRNIAMIINMMVDSILILNKCKHYEIKNIKVKVKYILEVDVSLHIFF